MGAIARQRDETHILLFPNSTYGAFRLSVALAHPSHME
jgi:hypothetical protein